MEQLTFITPCAPHHRALLNQAIDSVLAQTVPCKHLSLIDDEAMGPGVIRNRLLVQVDTPYVAFLDADDWVEPTFAEKALAVIQPGRYVYTDWWRDEVAMRVPDNPWCTGNFHLVTAVVATETARTVGGFDENLPGMEDTDFYLKLIAQGTCGIHIKEPLVHYRANGGRASRIHDTGELAKLKDEIDARYGGIKLMCCGDPVEPQDNTPIGERQPGDVLAMALWQGNRREMGFATGRQYPRTSYPKTVWVDPRDVQITPHRWQIVPENNGGGAAPVREPENPTVRGVDALVGALIERRILKPSPRPRPQFAPARMPNVRKVQRLAGAIDLPTFVAPRKVYPSYADFWRLADLSGFEVIYADEADLGNPDDIYIFVTPEGIPNCAHARARTIFWQLEYVGDYTEQPNRETCDELWASDPVYAMANEARFVLLGSHPGLNPTLDRGDTAQYDVLMLAYMTDRRRRVREALAGWSWPPLYPGHDTDQRHDILRSSRLMLHVQQHDRAACAPLRYALAAAYRLPMIAEMVPDPGPYLRAIFFTEYANLPAVANTFLRGRLEADYLHDALYRLLCIEHPFYDGVMEAIHADRGIHAPALRG
jgi:hypothetical protein